MITKWLQMLAFTGIASIALTGAATAGSYSIYSTGFVSGSNSVEQANRGVDGNYTIIEAASSPVSDPAYVTNKTSFPITPGPWLPDSSLSQWISPLPAYGDGEASPAGVYGYQTDLGLWGLGGDVGYEIQGLWATDNSYDGIYVNGNLIPGTIGPANVNEFASFTAFTDTAFLHNGVNTLDFYVIQGPGASNNPTGLDTQLAGVYYTVPEPSTVIPLALGVMGIGMLMIRRRHVS
jgi:hypothetical protein